MEHTLRLNETEANPDSQSNEAELVRQAATDRRAFGALYDLHVDAVYRYAFFRLRTVPEAEDVTADVFERALRAMPRYEHRRPYLAFLYTIARNVIADRARKARPVATLDEARFEPENAPGPEAISERLDDARRLRTAIEGLTPLQQEIVILRLIEGRPTSEVAGIVGKPESTIRGIQMRALEALRMRLPLGLNVHE